MKTYPSAQSLGFFAVEPRVPWPEAKGNPLRRLAEWVETTDGAVCRSAEAEAMLAQKQVARRIHELAYRNRPLSDEQKESNRQKSKLRVRIEHVFGYMSQSMRGFYLRYIGRRRNAAAIGLRDLNSEDQNQKRRKTNQPRKINCQESTDGSRSETIHTENRTATINPTPKSSFRMFPLEEVWRREEFYGVANVRDGPGQHRGGSTVRGPGAR